MHSSSGIPQTLFLCLNSNPQLDDECFSIECRKSKTKVRRTINQNQRNYLKEEPWVIEAKTSKLPEERENAIHQVEMVVVLHLIGWDDGASDLDQSKSEVKQNQK